MTQAPTIEKAAILDAVLAALSAGDHGVAIGLARHLGPDTAREIEIVVREIVAREIATLRSVR